jgi:hypothetical protein
LARTGAIVGERVDSAASLGETGAMRWLCFAGVLALGCGSSVVGDPQASGAGVSSSGTGGASATAGASTTNVATTGAGGTGGDTGSGGASPADATCAGLDYCGCVANAACQVIAEDCFCPCGVEPCEPEYLGCAPTSILNPGALEGIWLIGWSGGANHFSWVRIEADAKITVNDGAALVANLPYYECNGPGGWMITAKPETIMLELPADCSWSSLTFSKWTGTPAYPPGCLQEVIVEDNTTASIIGAWRFPPDQCDAAMTSCTDPF